MKTVFVVEPDRALARSYASVLGSEHVEVAVFHTAQAAIKALDETLPSVIVLEVALPTHNGLEFLYELRSYSDTNDVKVIIHSHITEEDLGIGYVTNKQLGIVGYVSKNSLLNELKKAVYAHL